MQERPGSFGSEGGVEEGEVGVPGEWRSRGLERLCLGVEAQYFSKYLVSHYRAIGNTISCDAPYSAIGFIGKLFLRYPPLLALSLDCDRPSSKKEVGV